MRRATLCAAAGFMIMTFPDPTLAQQGSAAGSPSSSQPPSRITLPTVTVTAQKEPADPQELPVSVTTVLSGTIEDADITSVSDAGIYSPNAYFSEFTARKLSNPRFRGIGSSPSNPAITTYIDGVPQLNANSSSQEFLDVSQVEFVRGSQSALFGRNTLGGLININSTSAIADQMERPGGRAVRQLLVVRPSGERSGADRAEGGDRPGHRSIAAGRLHGQ